MSDFPPPPPGPPPAYPPPPPPSGGGSVSPNRPVMLVLSYLSILALIPFLVEKEDREVQWHAKHGLVLFGAELILWIALTVFTGMAVLALGSAARLFLLLLQLVWLGILGLHIFLIVKALNGERFKIPQLSDLADRF